MKLPSLEKVLSAAAAPLMAAASCERPRGSLAGRLQEQQRYMRLFGVPGARKDLKRH